MRREMSFAEAAARHRRRLEALVRAAEDVVREERFFAAGSGRGRWAALEKVELAEQGSRALLALRALDRGEFLQWPG